jgi:hypothetical protein
MSRKGRRRNNISHIFHMKFHLGTEKRNKNMKLVLIRVCDSTVSISLQSVIELSFGC